jgi:hypothetical protein
MACCVMVNCKQCRAAPLRGQAYCFAHRNVIAGEPNVTLPELLRMAGEFDRTAGELFTATEFVLWATPNIRQRDEERERERRRA